MTNNSNRPEVILIHHTVSSRDRTSFSQVNEWHKTRWPNFISQLGWHIGYQYVIKGDGEVLQARKEDEEGAHTLGGWNRKSVGICLMGSFDHENPSTAQIEALERLLGGIRQRWGIERHQVFGHQEKWATKCPGKNMMTWVRGYRLNEKSEVVEKPGTIELSPAKVGMLKQLKKLNLQVIILGLMLQLQKLRNSLHKKK